MVDGFKDYHVPTKGSHGIPFGDTPRFGGYQKHTTKKKARQCCLKTSEKRPVKSVLALHSKLLEAKSLDS